MLNTAARRAATVASLLGVTAAAAVLGSSAADAGTTTDRAVSITMNQSLVAPRLGGSVGFTVDMNGIRAKNPRLVLKCWQSGTLVYAVNGGLSDSFKLGGDSSPWQAAGGSAYCDTFVADYVYKAGKWTVTVFDGEIGFTAAG